MIKPGSILLMSALALLFACSEELPLPTPAPDSARQLKDGMVIGFADKYETWSWLGIPYARPPIGEMRWRAPQAAAPWEATLQALSFASMCPQLPIPVVNDTDEPLLGDEDCLYLNISAPRSWSPGDKPLPVMVWMHGGGNSVGSADLYTAIRNLAAREQVITVSIHYRLGILGWFSHPALRAQATDKLDASGNFGTLDTIAALQWVQGNIMAFGGDATNVTIFGESAGGFNIFALLLSPLAENLFHRAISQSGMLMTSTVASAENATDAPQPGGVNSATELLLRFIQGDNPTADREQARQILARWDNEAIMAYLRDKSPQQLLEHMQGAQMGLYPFANLLRDGVVLPAGNPLKHLENGEFNRVPVILGTNRDEVKTLMLRNPDYTDPLFGVLPRVSNQPLYDRITGYGSAMWKAVGADEPARAMHLAGHNDVFVYRFDWDEMPSNWLLDFKSLMGAGHSLEIPFVFHDLDNEMRYMPMDLIVDDNRAEAEPLARAMSSYWGQFAHQGDPATGRLENSPRWSAWQGEEKYIIFDTADEGGIHMGSGGLDRDSIFRQLAGDRAALSGQAGVCLAYNSLFGANAIFGFTTHCPDGNPCAGSPEHFCPCPTLPTDQDCTK
jgi:para-nitrobenzyl esterase